jgi:hypothetical protein
MRKKAEVDIERQKWNSNPLHEDSMEMFGKKLRDSMDKTIMDSFTYKGQPISKRLKKFWRVNEEMNLEGAMIGEPLDELRIKVAQWLM